MPDYNAEVIFKFADQLYKEASSILVTHTLLGGILAGVVGYLAASVLDISSGATIGVGAAVFGALLGYAMARERAFKLRLQAQTALCQVKIEENTRA